MLDQNIHSARKATAQRYKKNGLIVVGGLCLCGVLIAAVSLLPEAPVSKPVEATTTPSSEVANAVSKEQEQHREAFKTALKAFEAQYAEQLTNEDIQNWSPERTEAVTAEYNKALAQFAEGSYLQGLNSLKQTEQAAEGLLQDWRQAWQGQFELAMAAFQQDKAPEAELLLAQTRDINRNTPGLEELAKRVQRLPEVLRLQQQLQVAQAEGNTQKQLNTLEQILAVDPQRQSISKQLQTLKIAVAEQNKRELVNRGLTAIDGGDLNLAQRVLQAATDIAPKDAEVALLKNKLVAAQRQRKLDQGLAQINEWIESDNWPQVKSLVDELLPAYPEHKTLLDYQKTANQLASVNQRLAHYLASPERLEDQSVRTRAQSWLQASQDILNQSFQATLKAQALQEHIAHYQQPVAVALRSDGKTKIKVIGVGWVEPTKLKRLTLVPGTYVFEGSRKGYRSVRVTLDVDASSTPLDIEVVCRERI